MSRLLLAPMEGLADDVLREVLTCVGGYDQAVTEFVRVSGNLLPNRAFIRISPELKNAGRTSSGTPVVVQLLGSDPASMAANAARLAQLAPPAIDLNFGCPAPTVNRHRGGAALLGEPELLNAIVSAVRAAVPAGIPVTAKMRLGIADSSLAVDCAQAIAAGGVDELIVHGRTKVYGYKPPARWAQIDRVRAAVSIPIIANGEVWTVADFRQCQLESGCADVMLGRGALADPLLPRKLRGEATGGWAELLPSVATYWRGVRERVMPVHAGGRLKQWLMLLRRHYPEAEALYQQLRPVKAAEDIDAMLVAAGVLDSLPERLLLAA